jgi:hypothetical protein
MTGQKRTISRAAGLAVAVSLVGALGLGTYHGCNQLQREKQEREEGYRVNLQLAHEVEQSIAGADGIVSNSELQDFLDEVGVKQDTRFAARRVSIKPFLHSRDGFEVRAYELYPDTSSHTAASGMVPSSKLKTYLAHVRSQGK